MGGGWPRRFYAIRRPRDGGEKSSQFTGVIDDRRKCGIALRILSVSEPLPFHCRRWTRVKEQTVTSNELASVVLFIRHPGRGRAGAGHGLRLCQMLFTAACWSRSASKFNVERNSHGLYFNAANRLIMVYPRAQTMSQRGGTATELVRHLIRNTPMSEKDDKRSDYGRCRSSRASLSNTNFVLIVQKSHDPAWFKSFCVIDLNETRGCKKKKKKRTDASVFVQPVSPTTRGRGSLLLLLFKCFRQCGFFSLPNAASLPPDRSFSFRRSAPAERAAVKI